MLTLILLGLFLQEQAPEKVVPSALHNRSNQDINWMIDPDRDVIIYDEIQAIAAELAEGRIPSNIGCLTFDDQSVIVNSSDCSHMLLRYIYLRRFAFLFTAPGDSKERILSLKKKKLIESGLNEAAFNKLVKLLKTNYNILFLREQFNKTLLEPDLEAFINHEVSYQQFLDMKKQNKDSEHQFMLNWSNGLLDNFSKKEQAIIVSYAFTLGGSGDLSFSYQTPLTQQDYHKQIQMVKEAYTRNQDGQQ